MWKNSVAAVSSMLATRRSLANICCFDQNYQIGKITLQVLIQMIEYLFAAPLIMDAVIFALLLPLIAVLTEIGIEESGMQVW